MQKLKKLRKMGNYLGSLRITECWKPRHRLTRWSREATWTRCWCRLGLGSIKRTASMSRRDDDYMNINAGNFLDVKASGNHKTIRRRQKSSFSLWPKSTLSFGATLSFMKELNIWMKKWQIHNCLLHWCQNGWKICVGLTRNGSRGGGPLGI